MKSFIRWKILTIAVLLALLANCAPKRTQTQFAKNKEAESGQTYTEAQLRAAIGDGRYDELVAGIGQDNLSLLAYGIGISNMAQMINGITGPGKLTALMSNGPNSNRLSSTQVLDLLNKLDDACQQPGSFGTDTIAKMVNMINQVTVAGMEGIKNIVHGVADTAVYGYSDPNGPTYDNGIARLALLMSLLNETLSVMPTLINDVAAPGGVFSASGNAKLTRLVNQTKDMRDLAAIINGTTSLTSITGVMAGLTGNLSCSIPAYFTQATCAGAGYCSHSSYTTSSSCTGSGGTWIPRATTWSNTLCSNPTHATRAACTGAGAIWTADGTENMVRTINELDRVCSNVAHTNGTACINAGATWRTKASKIPAIVNNISSVSNMYTIVNGLSNDGRRPPWPTVALPVGLGLPAAYPGDPGNVFDGVDSMVATLNKLYVTTGAEIDADSFGSFGMKRLAYFINNLDTVGLVSNDSGFDTGTNCANGLFDNRLNWAFSGNQSVAGSPWYGKSWRSSNAWAQAGTCSIQNDATAADDSTMTQTAELMANITTSGNITFYTNFALGSADTARFFIDDTLTATYTGTVGSTLRTYAVSVGVRRFRWDVHRAKQSTGVFRLDTVSLPGEKGGIRTAAEKTYIMMNNLYIASSLTNVADILSSTTAPACITNPLTCIPTYDNGLDAMLYAVNRVEYPAAISSAPTTVAISNASPGLVTWTAHGLVDGIPVKFQTTGTLPAPLTANQVYYVRNSTANTFNVASAPGGTAINTSTAGSGSHYVITVPRLAVTVNDITDLDLMVRILNGLTSIDSMNQLVTLMDFIETPSNLPLLLNTLSGLGTVTTAATNTASILNNMTPAGASALLRLGANQPNGAPITDLARIINDAVSTVHIAQMMNQLKLSGNFYDSRTANVTISNASPTVITWTGHGFPNLSEVSFATTSSLPNGITPGLVYYVRNATANTFNISATPAGALINTNTAGAGTQSATASNEMYYATKPGGQKMADLINRANWKSAQAPAQNCVSGTTSDFCIKNHLVRLINDIAPSPSGPTVIADIVSGMRPDAGPGTNGTYPSGANGVERLIDLAYDVKAMNNVTPYTNQLSNSTSEDFGRLTTLVKTMTGAVAGRNTARLLNEVNLNYQITRVAYLLRNFNRIRYMSRLLSELTSMNLMIQILNDANTNPTRLRDIVNGAGNLAYGTNAVATELGSFYSSAAQTGHKPVRTTTYGAGGSGLDTLGRLIQLINNTTAASNVTALMNLIYDTRFMGATNGVTVPNSMPTPYNPDANGARNYGYGMINEVDRIDYLTNLINGVENLDLFLTIVNGPGRCSNVTYQSRSTCQLAGQTWTEGTMGNCSNGTSLNQVDCVAAAATWTPGSNIVQRSAQYTKMISLINDIGGSTRKGSGTKAVGDLSILANVVNDLGWLAGAPQPLVNQARVITILNDVEYCGVNPANDRNITGPACTNTNYTNNVSCVNAGGTWNNAGQMLACNQPIGYAYNQATDFYDARPRVANMMLGMNDSYPMAVIVGQVTTTQKTVRIVNGFRRVNALVKIVNWLPGEATRDLVDTVDIASVYRGLDYIANNISGNEDKAAKAFVNLIFWGTTIGQGGSRNTTPCLSFTAIGPKRMAGVLNTEGGQYLEGLLLKFGWRTVIPLMGCGLSPHGNTYESYGSYNAGSPAWQTSGTAINANAADNVCRNTPASDRCLDIPGGVATVRFKQKEAITTYGSCSNAAYRTRHTCTSNGATWDSSTGSVTWVFGVKNAATNSACKLYYPEGAGAYGHNFPLDDTLFLGNSAWANTVNPGIGGVWNILKGDGILGWMVTESGYINFPPNQGGGYTCTDGGSGNEWDCVDAGIASGSTHRWGNQCSIPQRGATNCNANYSTCEGASCQGRWINDKDFTFASCGVDPSTGAIEPLQ